MYTTSDGERRIRVHNLNLPVTTNMQDLYANLDVRASMNVLVKTAVEQALTTKMIDARSRLQVIDLTPWKHLTLNPKP